MTISLYLKRPKADTETSIFAVIFYDSHKLKYYTPEKISPKFWNAETQLAKQTERFREYPEFNQRLKNWKTDVANLYRKWVNDHNGIIPNPETLKAVLDKELKKIEPVKQHANTFFGFYQSIIDQTKKGVRLHPKTGQPVSANTLKTYVTTFKHLSAFQQITKRKIDFDTINLDFYAEYTEYLMKTLKLSNNTVGKHIQIIKLVLNEATERGLNSNLAFKSKRFLTVREKSDSIYLTVQEMEAIEVLNLSDKPKLEKVRDLFLIGCYTGLRYSDYSILKPEQIKDGFIETTQIKTGEPVIIPIHPAVKRILEKYDNALPPSISNQKTNDYLKELGKLVSSLHFKTNKSITKGGVKLTSSHLKWELLTTHTARRSFATNEYLAGTPTLTIMAITGHKTEKAFLRYIKLTPSEHAKLLQLHWKNRHGLKAV